MNEWQPIATAPRRMEEPLLLARHGRTYYGEFVPRDNVDGGSWKCSGVYHSFTYFTHWHPLPAPPDEA
jgi:hypothetical protein